MSYNNYREELCFPSYATIAKRAGCSRRFIIESIARLENAMLITVRKSSERMVSNRYKFTNFETFVTVPFKIFELDELTAHEKAMLIIFRQFFSGETLQCIFSDPIVDISKHMGLTYKTVYTQYVSLVSKGFIIDQVATYKKLYQIRQVYLSDKLQWTFKPEPESDRFEESDWCYINEKGSLVMIVK